MRANLCVKVSSERGKKKIPDKTLPTTYQEIIKKMSESKLIHIDETIARIPDFDTGTPKFFFDLAMLSENSIFEFFLYPPTRI